MTFFLSSLLLLVDKSKGSSISQITFIALKFNISAGTVRRMSRVSENLFRNSGVEKENACVYEA